MVFNKVRFFTKTDKKFFEISFLINKILREYGVTYKYIDNTLFVYPDNYGSTKELSRTLPLYELSETRNKFIMTFNLELTSFDRTELNIILPMIKNNSFSSSHWVDTLYYDISHNLISTNDDNVEFQLKELEDLMDK